MGIGDRIRDLRKQKGLTQKELGERCKPPIADSTIRSYELGRLNPGLNTRRKIAKALDVNLGLLLTDERGEPMSKEEITAMMGSMIPMTVSERVDLIDKLKVVTEMLELSKEMADITGHEMDVDRIAFTILSEIMASVQEAAELPFC